MPFTKLEQELRLIARERIATGQLPSEGPSRMWGGYGTGQICSLCDKPIEAHDVEYEAELTGAAVQTFRFHVVCQSVWQLECARDNDLKKHPQTA
jgi:hypothetical protein